MITFDSLSLADASDQMRAGGLTPVAYLAALLDGISRQNASSVNAFISLTPQGIDRAMASAEQATQALRRGEDAGALHGIPYGLKDLIDYQGVATTGQCQFYRANVATRDAFVVRRLKTAGAVFLGKLATDELACGGRPEDSAWPVPSNPWNPAYITGGSSSGSAVAVAAGFVPFALGTDTGGSIRNPSSRCGLVGLKPTYGRVSRDGLMPLSWSQDHIGPITRTVRDNALVLQCIAGHDASDKTSSRHPVDDYAALIGHPLAGMTIGVLSEPFLQDPDADPEQVAGIMQAVEVLRHAGAKIVERRLAGIPHINAVARLLLGADGFAVHADGLRTAPDLYGKGARSRLLQGAWLSMADYVDLQRRRAGIVESIERLMAGIDVLVTASGYDRAPKVGDASAFAKSYDQQLRMPFNLSGHPAMVVPTGVSAVTGLPSSMQIVGHYFDEARMYQVAAAYESQAPWSAPGPRLNIHPGDIA